MAIWNWQTAQAELTRFVAPGTLGFYTHFEATEVFAVIEGQKTAINLFSILVAEDRSKTGPFTVEYLTQKLKPLKSFKDLRFGIKRYVHPISELVPAITVMEETKEWQQSGDSLKIGNVKPLAPQFVPPDGLEAVPLNRVLKNNFWNGSYIFEWFDPDKFHLEPLFSDPTRLQELSEGVQEYVPLRLASLSDRLGSIIVQLPVTVIMSNFTQPSQNNNFVVNLAWHEKSTPCPLRVSCDLEDDRLISGNLSAKAQVPQTELPMTSDNGKYRGFIWDEQQQLILAATGLNAYINAASISMYIRDHEPRIFSIKQGDGSYQRNRVELIYPPISNYIGQSGGDKNGDWVQRRMYKDEVAKLKKERRFIQYNPAANQKQDEHQKALSDVRFLINEHGQEGAWLWDPYLSAHDIIQTLFHCRHSGADLRALTGGQEIPNSNKELDFIHQQREMLESIESNWRGLRLEYRVKRGQAGWAFHDRFLIFPKADRGALAWSLGTSINSLGKAHHILQRVDDGQLVMDSFLDLWSKLDQEDHLIWKKP